VKLEPVFDLGRDFGREGRVLRRAPGYRQHRHMRLAAFVFPERGDNGASAVFLTLVATPQMLAVPDVALADDEAGDRSRKRQTDHLSSASTCANSSEPRAVRMASIRSFVNSTVDRLSRHLRRSHPSAAMTTSESRPHLVMITGSCRALSLGIRMHLETLSPGPSSAKIRH
jgi:hypothetical protein